MPKNEKYCIISVISTEAKQNGNLNEAKAFSFGE